MIGGMASWGVVVVNFMEGWVMIGVDMMVWCKSGFGGR